MRTIKRQRMPMRELTKERIRKDAVMPVTAQRKIKKRG